jgi:AcrR family transcriptional regulator
MKKGLKTEILDTARRLFNERGYNGVSMRDIAGELDISVGNLTYYYKRKEDLVEAVAEQQHLGYRKAPPADTLEAMDAFFRQRLAFQRGNAYYFRHYVQLAQISPKVYEMHRRVIGDFYEYFTLSFQRFRQAGLMREEVFEGQGRYLAKALTTLLVFGMPMGEERLPCFWSLIHPTLTPKGAAICRTLMENAGGESLL